MSTIQATVTQAPGARTSTYPAVHVAGDARERGRSYGAQTGDRVAASIRGYEQAFRFYTGWGWDRVREEALRFEAAIDATFPSYVEEMRGLAEGADVPFADVIAINVRTEIMFAGQARSAAGHPPSECSAIGLLPDVTADGHTLLAQNWDWLEHCFDTVVVLEVEPDEGPCFVTVVEAGLLAKTGLNEYGLGVCTNALVTTRDAGEPGIPYHVLLRAFMDARTPSEALSTVLAHRRSSSANFLIGHRDGIAMDMETQPGDRSRVHVLFPDDGVLLHTNHFLHGIGDEELSLWSMPDSPIRLDRLRRRFRAEPRPLKTETIPAALGDHGNHPNGICCHVDPSSPVEERGATIVSVLMDLDERRLWLANGNPCATPYAEHDLRGLFTTA
jgi:isopenicillin-N N-acyltransferase like protein